MLIKLTVRGTTVFFALMALLCVGPAGALAQEGTVEEDDWFGRDKMLHFGASAAIAAGGTLVGTRLFDTDAGAAGFGLVVSLGAGGLKEWSDSRGGGDPSWRDMAWNVAGAVVGAGIVYLWQRSRGSDDLDSDDLGALPRGVLLEPAPSYPPNLTASTLPRGSAALPMSPFSIEAPVTGSLNSLTTMACAPSFAASLLSPSTCVASSVMLAGPGR